MILFVNNKIQVSLSQEFMLATNMSDTTSSEEKLRWAFKMYDQDSSGDNQDDILCLADIQHVAGSIDVAEMVEIVGNLYEMEGVSKVNQNKILRGKSFNTQM